MKDLFSKIKQLEAKKYFKWGYWTFALSFLIIQVPGCYCGPGGMGCSLPNNSGLNYNATQTATQTASQTPTQTATIDASATEAARNTSIAETVSAIQTETEAAKKPADEQPPEEEQQPQQPTATATATSTQADANADAPSSSVPIISVSLDTACRIGPGNVYQYLGALIVGEEAEIVARDPSSKYWYIKNPDGNGFCWVWGEYGTIVGDTSKLPIYTPIPTPTFTPTATFTATYTPYPTDTPTMIATETPTVVPSETPTP